MFHDINNRTLQARIQNTKIHIWEIYNVHFSYLLHVRLFRHGKEAKIETNIRPNVKSKQCMPQLLIYSTTLLMHINIRKQKKNKHGRAYEDYNQTTWTGLVALILNTDLQCMNRDWLATTALLLVVYCIIYIWCGTRAPSQLWRRARDRFRSQRSGLL